MIGLGQGKEQQRQREELELLKRRAEISGSNGHARQHSPRGRRISAGMFAGRNVKRRPNSGARAQSGNLSAGR